MDQLGVLEEQKGFTSQCALAQYILDNSRADVCANNHLITTGASTTTREKLNSCAKTVKHLRDRRTHGLKFQKLYVSTLKIIVITDESFANTCDLRSQLQIAIAMAHVSGRFNVLHFSSGKWRRVTGSGMAPGNTRIDSRLRARMRSTRSYAIDALLRST